MEDLVAVKITTADGGVGFFVTWGRIPDVVDPSQLERLVLKVAHRFALPGPAISAQVCDSLHDARDAEWFYEALFYFAQQPIPFGPGYPKWRARKEKLMRRGKDLYYAGSPIGQLGSLDPAAGSIVSGTLPPD